MRTDSPAAADGSDLSACEATAAETKQLVYLGDDAHVHELYIYATGDWGHGDLAHYGRTSVKAAPGSALNMYEMRADSSKQVAYLDSDGHVHELRFAHGGSNGWQHFDRTQLADAPPAAITSRLSGYAWSARNTTQIVYLDESGHVHELSGDLDGKWTHSDLTEATDAPVALRSSPLRGYEWPAANAKHVAYLDEHRRLHELRMTQGEGWRHRDLAEDRDAPPAGENSDITAFVHTIATVAELAYYDESGHVREIILELE